MRLSIIIPAYNAEQPISACLRSIFDALTTPLDFEVLVIDDGSTDSTTKIIHQYQKIHPELRIFSQIHHGVSSARNFGLAQAKGEYICFVDADDTLAQNWCKVVIGACQKHRTSDFIIFSDSQSHPQTNEDIILAICGINSSNHMSTVWSKLYKKSIIDEHHIVFSEQIINGEDLLFNLQYNFHAKSPCFVSHTFYNYTPQTISATQSFNSNFIASDTTFQKTLKGYLEQYPIESSKILLFSRVNAWLEFFKRYSYNQKYQRSEFQALTENSDYQQALQQYRHVSAYFPRTKLIILRLLQYHAYHLVYLLFRLKCTFTTKKSTDRDII